MGGKFLKLPKLEFARIFPPILKTERVSNIFFVYIYKIISGEFLVRVERDTGGKETGAVRDDKCEEKGIEGVEERGEG